MRRASLAVALGLLGCGPAPLIPERQVEVCQALVEQVTDGFGCRADELTSHASGVDQRYTVEVQFQPNGRVARYRELRARTETVMDGAGRAPDCVARTVAGLHARPYETEFLVPIGLRYAPEVTPRAEMRDQRCWLTIPAK